MSHAVASHVGDTLIAAHDAGRLQTLATIRIRYGFGDLLRRLGLSQALARAGRFSHWCICRNWLRCRRMFAFAVRWKWGRVS